MALEVKIGFSFLEFWPSAYSGTICSVLGAGTTPQDMVLLFGLYLIFYTGIGSKICCSFLCSYPLTKRRNYGIFSPGTTLGLWKKDKLFLSFSPREGI
jgi:hypothetical protein